MRRRTPRATGTDTAFPLPTLFRTEMMTMREQGGLTPTGLDHSKMKRGESSAAMDHNDPNSVLVEPGETKELVWRFAANTGLEFACNIPGHYESGMMGEIDVKIGRAHV